MPIAATTQMLAAVVRPRMISRRKMMTPAPRKPIPETICAATREGSNTTAGGCTASPKPNIDTSISSAEPTHTSACVRRPAADSTRSRSRPTMLPTIAASASRSTISSGLMWARSIPLPRAHCPRKKSAQEARRTGDAGRPCCRRADDPPLRGVLRHRHRLQPGGAGVDPRPSQERRESLRRPDVARCVLAGLRRDLRPVVLSPSIVWVDLRPADDTDHSELRVACRRGAVRVLDAAHRPHPNRRQRLALLLRAFLPRVRDPSASVLHLSAAAGRCGSGGPRSPRTAPDSVHDALDLAVLRMHGSRVYVADRR